MSTVLPLPVPRRRYLWLLPVLCACTARAAIVATFPLQPQLISIVNGAPAADYASVDFNHDGTPEFYMNSGGIYLALTPTNRVFIRRSLPPNHGGLVGNLNFGFSLYADSVRPGYGWYEGFLTDSFTASWPEIPRVAVVDFGSCFTPGPCVSEFLQRSGYLGIEMNLGGSTHYGWVHINNWDLGIGGYLDAWAYETVPGQAIAIGAVPEPGTWTLSSAAAAFALARRKRRHHGRPRHDT